MNISAFSHRVVSSFKETILPSLTPLHKKIFIVISLVLNCLAACYLINRSLKERNVDAKERFLTSSKIMDLANQRFAKHRLKNEIVNKIQDSLRPMQGEEIVKKVILSCRNLPNPPPDERATFDHTFDFFKDLNFFKDLDTQIGVEE
jgi:hypothetical protein